MPDEMNPNDPRNLWQGQEVEIVTLTVDEVRRRAARFERRIHRRNVREYAAGALVVAFLTVQLWRAHGWRVDAGRADDLGHDICNVSASSASQRPPSSRRCRHKRVHRVPPRGTGSGNATHYMPYGAGTYFRSYLDLRLCWW